RHRPLGGLHLHHVGAQPRELGARELTRRIVGELDHPQSLVRRSHQITPASLRSAISSSPIPRIVLITNSLSSPSNGADRQLSGWNPDIRKGTPSKRAGPITG